jgi:hypothetical protein
MMTKEKSRRWRWILVVVAFLAAQSAHAQIFGRVDNTVFKVDPVTGAQTPLTTLPTSFQSAALDASSGRLYLADSNTLYIVNVATGSFGTVALSQSLGLSPYEIVFDRVSGSLFGLVESGSRIVSINPATGNVTTVAFTGVSSSLAGSLTVGSGGASVLFDKNRTDLYRVNLATGITSHVPFSEEVAAIQFDPASGKLIGLSVVTNGFVMADPDTGVVQHLTGAVAFQLIGTNVPFLRYDPVARVAVAYAFASPVSERIIVFAVATGTVTSLDDPTFVSPIAVSIAGAEVPLLSPTLLAALALVFCAIALFRLWKV